MRTLEEYRGKGLTLFRQEGFAEVDDAFPTWKFELIKTLSHSSLYLLFG